MKSNHQWKEELSPETYRIMREKGTEAPFTGKYYKHKEKGVYCCAACGEQLFASEAKYDSGSGWPSFWEPVQEGVVEKEVDKSSGMVREEIHCTKCGGHLGHVFTDGPRPTGLRYCINSGALEFKEKKDI